MQWDRVKTGSSKLFTIDFRLMDMFILKRFVVKRKYYLVFGLGYLI